MPAPTLASFAKRIYADLSPLSGDDPTYNYALANYVAALGTMFQIVEDLARDQLLLPSGVIAPGWSQAVDINRAPASGLAWLAQFVGGATQVGLSDSDQRNFIKAVGGWKRGTASSMMNAIAALLTGAKTVIFVERNGANDTVYDFESGVQGWTLVTGATVTQDATQFRGGGAHSLKIAAAASAGSGGQSPVLAVTATAKFGVRMSALIPAGVTARFRVRDVTNSLNLATATVIGSGSWQEIALSGQATIASTNVAIIVDNNAVATAMNIYIDDVHWQADGPYSLTVITRNSETPVADWGALQYVQNSGAETNTTGHTASAPNTITRDTGVFYSGVASFRYNKVTGAVTQYDDIAVTLPAGGVWTVSTRVYIPTGYDGTDVTLNIANFTGATDVDASHAAANMALRDQWQQIYRVVTIAGTDLIGDLILTSAGASNGKFFYADEWQMEDNPGVSGYIATNGAIGSRAAGGGPVGAALAKQKPAGIILSYAVTDGLTYLELRATKASYTATVSGYANYTALRGY